MDRDACAVAQSHHRRQPRINSATSSSHQRYPGAGRKRHDQVLAGPPARFEENRGYLNPEKAMAGQVHTRTTPGRYLPPVRCLAEAACAPLHLAVGKVRQMARDARVIHNPCPLPYSPAVSTCSAIAISAPCRAGFCSRAGRQRQ